MTAATIAPPSAAQPPPAGPAVPRPPRRVAEIGLLVLALAVGLGAYAQVGLTNGGRLPEKFWVVAAAAAGAVALAHVAVRVLAPWSDQVLLPVAVAINGLGLAMIHRLDLAETVRAAQNHQPAPHPTAGTQLVWTGLGLALIVLVLLVVRDHRMLQRFTYTAMVVGLALLVLPLVPGIGVTINGARIWIRVGSASRSSRPRWPRSR